MRRLRLSSSRLATPLGATLSYATLMLFWLLLSDPLLESLASDREELTDLQTTKDAAFVVLTAPLLYVLIRQTRKVAHEALEELREEKAFTESALMALPDIFYAFDAEGKMLRWNNRTEKITGYTTEEIAQMSPLDFVADKERVKEAIETVLEERRPVTVEARYLTKSGEEIPYEFTGAELTDSEDRAVGIVGTGRDISFKKKLEEEKRMISKQERAWFAQELHDGICQQLTSLSIMATMLKRQLQEDPEEALDRLDKLSSIADRAVKEVRALSHGAAPVDFMEEDFRKVMEQLVTETGEAHQIDCSFEAEESVEVTDPDVATNLYRIAQEALTNGIRHGEAQRIRVELGACGEDLVLRVKDDGKGIGKEIRGNGIGLENMRRRARLIGGTLEVEPGAGGGTVVTCTAPEDRRSTEGASLSILS